MRWHEKPIPQKLATWLIFGVVIAMTPFIFELLQLIDRGRDASLSAVLGSGQLLLVCAVIAAGAMGELVLVEVASNRRFAKLISIGGCVIVVIVASLWFGDISATLGSGEDPNPRTITNGSLAVFAATLMTSAACLVLSTAKTPSPDRTAGSAEDALRVLRALLEAKS